MEACKVEQYVWSVGNRMIVALWIAGYFFIGYICYRVTLWLYVAERLSLFEDDWTARYYAGVLFCFWPIFLPFGLIVVLLTCSSKKRLESLKNKKESK